MRPPYDVKLDSSSTRTELADEWREPSRLVDHVKDIWLPFFVPQITALKRAQAAVASATPDSDASREGATSSTRTGVGAGSHVAAAPLLSGPTQPTVRKVMRDFTAARDVLSAAQCAGPHSHLQ